MVVARDGTSLLARTWPAAGTPWGTILVVHGLGEHSGRHDATGGRFAAAGLAASSFDHRGFGASGGRRAYVDSWDDYLDDIEDRLAASRGAGIPAAIYAHSLGGLLAADYLLADRPLPDVAVLSAPALGGGSSWLRSVAHALDLLAPTLSLSNPWDRAKIAREPQPPVVAEPDPRSLARTTGRLGHLVFRAMDRVNARLAERGGFPIPVLVVHGGDDRLVPTGSTAFLETYGSVQRRVYPDVRHEPHHDPFDGERIVDEVIDWLAGRMGRPAG
jgi:alpha-beta hydrolase superfamily lysophospholipase